MDLNIKTKYYCAGAYDHFSIINHFQDRERFLEWDKLYEPKRFFSIFGIRPIIKKLQLSDNISINLVFIENNKENRNVANNWVSSIDDHSILSPDYLKEISDLEKLKASFFNNFNKGLSYI